MYRLGILSLLLVLLGCRGQSAASLEAEDNPMDKPLRYLALGDSYTVGEGVAEVERWPNQLAELLYAEGYDIDEALIVARSGWTTDELAAGIQQAEISPPYDLVSLLIGVNNQFRGYSQESYRKEFASLLEQAVTYAGGRPGRVMVLSIPDWGVTPFGSNFDRQQVAREIDAFNAINQQEAERAGVRYVDITPVSRQDGDDLGMVAIDDLHPSGRMYAKWAELALKSALEALQE